MSAFFSQALRSCSTGATVHHVFFTLLFAGAGVAVGVVATGAGWLFVFLVAHALIASISAFLSASLAIW